MQSDLNFGDALAILKNDGKVARTGWLPGQYLLIDEQIVDEQPLRVIHVYDEPDHGPWTPTNADILAEDWHEYEEPQQE